MLPRTFRSLVVVAIAVAIASSGCALERAETPTAPVRVSLTDAPVAAATGLEVTFGRVDLVPAGEDGGGIVSVTADAGRIDVLALRNGGLHPFGLVDVPAGTYTQVRLIVDEASLVFGDDAYNVFVPSGAQTGLKVTIEPPLVVTAGEVDDVAHVIIDFDVLRAIVETPPGSLSYLLIPTAIRALTQVGSLTGRVVEVDQGAAHAGVGGAWIDVLDAAGTPITSTLSEADGSFAFITLHAGVYDVRVSHEVYQEAVIERVTVTVGEVTDVGLVAIAPAPLE